MKKFVNELSTSQSILYEYLNRVASHDDGINFIESLTELNDSFECVPEKVYNSYTSLSSIEIVEVIHFFTKYLLRKNND